jgi:hypothetical protein
MRGECMCRHLDLLSFHHQSHPSWAGDCDIDQEDPEEVGRYEMRVEVHGPIWRVVGSERMHGVEGRCLRR